MLLCERVPLHARKKQDDDDEDDEDDVLLLSPTHVIDKIGIHD
jgi:hypothetical protein